MMQFINFINVFQFGAYFLLPFLPKPLQTLVTLSTVLSLAPARVLATGTTAFGVYQGLSTNSLVMNFMTANTDNTFNVAGYMTIGGLIANSNSVIGQVDDKAQPRWFHQQNAGGQNQFLGQAVIGNALYSVGFSSVSGQIQQPYMSINRLDNGDLIKAYSIGGFSTAARMTSLVATSNDTLICLGYTATTPFIMEFDPAQGMVLSASYIAPAAAGAVGSVIIAADDGAYFIAGNTLDTPTNGWVSKVQYSENSWNTLWCQTYAVSSSAVRFTSLAEKDQVLAITGNAGISAIVGTLNSTTGVSNWNTIFSGLGVPRGIQFQTASSSNRPDLLLVTAYTQVGTPGGRSSGWVFLMNLNGTLHKSSLLAGTKVTQMIMSTQSNDGMINSLGATSSITSLGSTLFLRLDSNLGIDPSIVPSPALSYTDNTQQMTTQIKPIVISSYASMATPLVPVVTNITSLVTTITNNPITTAWQSYETVAPTSQPSGKPSAQPSSQPSQPTGQPSRQPTGHPSSRPSIRPSSWPTRLPSGQPSTRPTLRPSNHPSAQPTRQPSVQPSRQPTIQPSSRPSGQPSTRPTLRPSHHPSAQPTGQPSAQPSRQPTVQPSSRPSVRPSSWPTRLPSGQPTARPTLRPSAHPVAQPTGQPSAPPTRQPTAQPSSRPSVRPSSWPTRLPSGQPTTRPTLRPSAYPSAQPTGQPSASPTRQPTVQPSSRPSVRPSSWPTRLPSGQPTRHPSSRPSVRSSVWPSSEPSLQKGGSLDPSRLDHANRLTASELSTIVLCVVFLAALAPFALKKNRSWLKQQSKLYCSKEKTPSFAQILPELNTLEEGTGEQQQQGNALALARRDSLLILLSQIYIKIKEKNTTSVHPECIESIQNQLSNTTDSINSHVSTPEKEVAKPSSFLERDEDLLLEDQQVLEHNELIRNKIAEFMNKRDSRLFSSSPTPSEFAEMDEYYRHRESFISGDDSDLDSSSESSVGLN